MPSRTFIQTISGPLARVARALTEPSRAVTDPEQRRAARILAGTLLALIASVALVLLFAPLRGPRVLVVLIGVLTVAYVLSRTRLHQVCRIATLVICVLAPTV